MIKYKQTRLFDIKNRKDLEIAKNFFITYKWGPEGCPFDLELPYLTIPDMLKDKIMKEFFHI